MAEIFEDFSTDALERAIDHNLIARTLNFSHLLGGEIHPHNPAWFMTGEALPKFNGVVHATLSRDEIDRQIVAALRPFENLNQPVTWWVGPTSAPSDLGKQLQRQHDFHHNRDMIGMAVNLEDLTLPNPAPPLIFSPVRDREKLEAWYEVLLEGFPLQYDQQYLDALAAPAWTCRKSKRCITTWGRSRGGPWASAPSPSARAWRDCTTSRRCPRRAGMASARG